jgi:hypothetical protein
MGKMEFERGNWRLESEELLRNEGIEGNKSLRLRKDQSTIIEGARETFIPI